MARVTMLGRLADAAGWRTRVVEADTIGGLRLALETDAPGLSLNADAVAVIVNDAVARSDMAIGPDDEVGFMPPMSGG